MSLPSLAKGAKLDQSTLVDFVVRLNHDCIGGGSSSHGTAHALFVVQQKKVLVGIDRDYSDNCAILHDEAIWFNPTDYYLAQDDDEQQQLDALAVDLDQTNFLALSERAQLHILEGIDGVSVSGYHESWEYVCSHFTIDAAQAFIDRKKHDYKELRIFVESQTHCWEFETIKSALMFGQLTICQDDEIADLKNQLDAARAQQKISLAIIAIAALVFWFVAFVVGGAV